MWKKWQRELLDDNTELWYLGRLTEFVEREGISDRISVFDSIADWRNFRFSFKQLLYLLNK
jgi:hypothetical protein